MTFIQNILTLFSFSFKGSGFCENLNDDLNGLALIKIVILVLGS